MSNSSLDLVQIIRQKLIEDESVSNIVGANIYTAHIYDADDGTSPMPCIIVTLETGFSMSNRAVQFQDYEVYAYSKISQGEAMGLYDKIYSTLQSGRLAVDGISAKGLMTERTRPISGYNDRLKAWWVRAGWHVAAAG